MGERADHRAGDRVMKIDSIRSTLSEAISSIEGRRSIALARLFAEDINDDVFAEAIAAVDYSGAKRYRSFGKNRDRAVKVVTKHGYSPGDAEVIISDWEHGWGLINAKEKDVSGLKRDLKSLEEAIVDEGIAVLSIDDDDEGDDADVEIDENVESFLRYMEELVQLVVERTGVSNKEAVDEMVYDVIEQASEDGLVPPLPDIDESVPADLSAWVTACEEARIADLAVETVNAAVAGGE